jgi:hypothetical protein
MSSPCRRPISSGRGLRAALGAASLLAAGALLACGSSASPTSSSSANPANSALAFSRCMRSHGVTNFPDPETIGGQTRLRVKQEAGGPSPQTMEAAQKACRHLQPFEQAKLSPQEKVQRQEQVLKFARCMREHGVDVHASAQGGGVQLRIGGQGSGGPNPESPTFQAAQKACSGLLPQKRGGPGLSSTGSKAGGGPGPSLAGG